MSSPTFPCPHCGVILRPPQPVPAGRSVRCPSCQAVFVAGQQVEPRVELVREVEPRRSRRTSEDRPRRPARRRDDNDAEWDDHPRRRQGDEGQGNNALIWGLVLGGVAFFLAVGGVITIVLITARSEKDQQQPVAAVAPVPVRAVTPAQPPIQANAPPVAANMEGTIPAATLQTVKAATVFIKVRAGAAGASGSGFLFRSDHKVGYIITNHHVVDIKPDESAPFPFPRFPRFGPRLPRMPFPSPFFQQTIKPTVTVVVGSGTQQQRSLSAQVLASDEQADLAILRVVSTADLPAPLGLAQQPALVETLPVYVFGFPFGRALAIGHGDPAVTVGKANISSLRRDDRGQLARVQITGEINPGNSGGPIVDAQGRLVGVAVAKIVDTNIGLAIPSAEVLRMLEGRLAITLVARASVVGAMVHLQGVVCTLDRQNSIKSSKTVQLTAIAHTLHLGPPGVGGGVVALAKLVDPMSQFQSVHVHYVAGNIEEQARRGQDGNWQPLPAATTVALKMDDQKADALLNLSIDGPCTVQFSYRLKDGRQVYTQPKVVHLNGVPVPPKIAQLTPPVGPTNPPRAAQGLPPFGGREDKTSLNAGERSQILKALTSTDFFKRKQALDRLADVPDGPKNPAPVARALEPLVRDDNGFIRQGAIKALAIWGTTTSVPVLIETLKSPDVFTRQAGIEALAKLKDKRAAEPIAALLPDFACRQKAVDALKSFGPSAEKAVATSLKSTDLWLKKAACEIIKEVGTKESIPALKAIVNDPSIHIRVHVAPTAAEALRAIRARQKK